MFMPTGVNLVRLKEAQYRVPVRLAHYMDEFFRNCHDREPEANFRDYVQHLDLYGADFKTYRKNRKKLIDAFNDITGTIRGAYE
jgi:hypothetical protein